jgi:Clp amino terminal domain, pathogenicity island component
VSFSVGGVDDLLRLAEDEARMLGRTQVEPEHMLLAFCRRSPGRDLIAQRSVRPSMLHSAIARIFGQGDELLLGRIPRSARCFAVLDRTVVIGGQRGTSAPGDLEVLRGLAEDDRAGQVLAEAGIQDLAELIDETYPDERAPLEEATIRHQLLSAAMNEHTWPLRLPVPAFERFSAETRRAIGAAAETAARLEHHEVEPFHLLIGCLQVPESQAAHVLNELWADEQLDVIGEAVELARRIGPHPSRRRTSGFSELARRVVAEDALAVAYRHDHHQVTTGHLLLAALDSHDRTTVRMTSPHTQRLARSMTGGLPGDEHAAETDDELDWIAFDALMHTLTLDFQRILPPGWKLRGSARSDIHLNVPASQSESDFQIRPGWITTKSGSGSDRLQRVTLWMLERLQAAISETTGQPWPAADHHQPPPPYAQIIPQRFNSPLRLGYGNPETPVLRVNERDLLVHMLVHQA